MSRDELMKLVVGSFQAERAPIERGGDNRNAPVPPAEIIYEKLAWGS